MEYFLKMLDSPDGCYVLGSILLSFTVLLHLLSERRLKGGDAWMTVISCLPIMNIIIVSFLIHRLVIWPRKR